MSGLPTERCDKCKFWFTKALKTESLTPPGHCHRFPPSGTDGRHIAFELESGRKHTEYVHEFLVTLANDWCGEYTPRVPDETS